MSVACGSGVSYVVMETGYVWSTGTDSEGQLGIGPTAKNEGWRHARDLRRLETMSQEIVVMVAAAISVGSAHGALVTQKGGVWTWGNGEYGQLGHGDKENRYIPVQLDAQIFAGSLAVMVSCGNHHTLVLTAMQQVWSFGEGTRGQLGDGSQVRSKSMPTLVLCSAEDVDHSTGDMHKHLSNIVMVSSGEEHNIALGAEGLVWTWGYGRCGELGHNATTSRLVAGLVDGKNWASSGGGGGCASDAVDFLETDRVVMVAAGSHHTAAVMKSGALYLWGSACHFQLGLTLLDTTGTDENSVFTVRYNI